MGLPGERPYDIAKDPHLLRETRRAAQETGILLHDTENARIAAGVDVQDYEPRWRPQQSWASGTS